MLDDNVVYESGALLVATHDFRYLSRSKETIPLCSCHHFLFVNVYVSEFRGDDWVKLPY
jgi:hypothetical protein